MALPVVDTNGVRGLVPLGLRGLEPLDRQRGPDHGTSLPWIVSWSADVGNLFSRTTAVGTMAILILVTSDRFAALFFLILYIKGS